MIAAIPKIPSFVQPDCPPASKFDALTPNPITIHPSPAPEPKATPKCRPDNACELQLTNASRELARLRSMLLDAARCGEQNDPPPPCATPPPPSSDATDARRAYAPRPLGEPNEHREILPPHRPEPLSIHQQVSNLGTLVDVLL